MGRTPASDCCNYHNGGCIGTTWRIDDCDRFRAVEIDGHDGSCSGTEKCEHWNRCAIGASVSPNRRERTGKCGHPVTGKAKFCPACAKSRARERVRNHMKAKRSG